MGPSGDGAFCGKARLSQVDVSPSIDGWTPHASRDKLPAHVSALVSRPRTLDRRRALLALAGAACGARDPPVDRPGVRVQRVQPPAVAAHRRHALGARRLEAEHDRLGVQRRDRVPRTLGGAVRAVARARRSAKGDVRRRRCASAAASRSRRSASPRTSSGCCCSATACSAASGSDSATSRPSRR